MIGALKNQFDLHSEFLVLMTFYLIQIEPNSLLAVEPALMPLLVVASLDKDPIVQSVAVYNLCLLSSLPNMHS